jgi:hypothetical protein
VVAVADVLGAILLHRVLGQQDGSVVVVEDRSWAVQAVQDHQEETKPDRLSGCISCCHVFGFGQLTELL